MVKNRALLPPAPTLSRRAFVGGIAALAASSVAAAVGLPATGALARRPVPSSGQRLPVVGLGTWQAFDVGDSATELAPRRAVLRALADGGGCVVDSSPMYGRAEAVVGRLAAEENLGESLFLATKVWTRGRADGIAQMRRSMTLLRTDRLDLMQVHNLVDWRTHMDTLAGWKKDGRVRYTGITHYQASAYDELAAALRAARPDFVQINYSVAEPEAAQRLLPLAKDLGIAVLINRPYAGGQLFRRVRGHALPAWAAQWHCATWGQLLLKFILAHPAVTCVIPGTDKPRHMLDNLGAGSGPIPDAGGAARIAAYIDKL